jgi:hypothetical protein
MRRSLLNCNSPLEADIIGTQVEPAREYSRTPRPGHQPSVTLQFVGGRRNFIVKLRNNKKNREGLPMDVVPLDPGFAAEWCGVMLADVACGDAACSAARTMGDMP